MQRLACNEVLGDLPFELDAVGAVLGHGFHPLKARPNATRTRPERASSGGGAEMHENRKKVILFNAILAEAETSSHPRIELPAQTAANASLLGGQRRVLDPTAASAR
jgi:hypothetical protein